MGKGSDPRPINKKTYDENYDAIWGKCKNAVGGDCKDCPNLTRDSGKIQEVKHGDEDNS